jgi:predicted outer membrane lipoprotein
MFGVKRGSEKESELKMLASQIVAAVLLGILAAGATGVIVALCLEQMHNGGSKNE